MLCFAVFIMLSVLMLSALLASIIIPTVNELTVYVPLIYTLK